MAGLVETAKGYSSNSLKLNLKLHFIEKMSITFDSANSADIVLSILKYSCIVLKSNCALLTLYLKRTKVR